MFKYLFTALIVFSFSCDSVKTKKPTNKEAVIEKVKNQKPKWEDQIIGSKLLLNDFPEFWSYDVENYEENEFNLQLNKISEANKIEEINVLDTNYLMYSGNDNYIPYYVNFNIPNEKDSNYDLVGEFFFNKKVSVLIFKKEINNLGSALNTKLDVLIYNHSDNKIIDGLNISLIGNGDQHAYSRNFYIENGIINVRSFYIYDSESSSSSISKFKILPSGSLVKYFNIEEVDYKANDEKGKIQNNIKVGPWIEKKSNRFVGDDTYLEALYKEGKPIGKWNYYNLVNDEEKGTKLLMTEEYSDNGELIIREVIDKD